VRSTPGVLADSDNYSVVWIAQWIWRLCCLHSIWIGLGYDCRVDFEMEEKQDA
jgi:hypothetical protein